MVHAIFCAHGQLAGAMLDSVCMVYGEVNVSAVAFVPGENAADIAINLEKLVSAHTDEEHTLSADDLCQHLQAIASQCCVVWQQPETVEEEF